MVNLKNTRFEKSSVAQHIFENDQNIDHSNVMAIIRVFDVLWVIVYSVPQILRQLADRIIRSLIFKSSI